MQERHKLQRRGVKDLKQTMVVVGFSIELKKDRFEYPKRQSSRLSGGASEEFKGNDSSSEDEDDKRKPYQRRGKTITTTRKGNKDP
ncbi:hypothetical protein GOBAR_DD16302 [Gossypium barbadense]|nr:hypothetical protein GOBAR_DD16302 [Gossypium barbadense]